MHARIGCPQAKHTLDMTHKKACATMLLGLSLLPSLLHAPDVSAKRRPPPKPAATAPVAPPPATAPATWSAGSARYRVPDIGPAARQVDHFAEQLVTRKG